MKVFQNILSILLIHTVMQISATGQEWMDSSNKKPVVLLDHFFNHEINKKTGQDYHYIWSDTLSSGFSGWGKIFCELGFDTASLSQAPSANNLKKAKVYIIADPDDEKESVHPNYLDQHSIQTISNWVKDGGLLVLMANDSGNCEFDHFNNLAGAFGFQFKQVRRNVPGAGNADMEKASFRNFPDHPFFKDVHAVFIKEICTLDVNNSSNVIFKEGGDQLMAVIPFGKGQVVVFPDPWFYNEYLNGEPKCRLTNAYQNDQVARNIAAWLKIQ